MRKPEETRSRTARAELRGFSITELLVVVAIMAIMLAVTIPSWLKSTRALDTDDAAAQVLDFVRSGAQMAISQRQVIKLQLDQTNGRIRLVDENGAGAADDAIVREETLPGKNRVMFGAPTGFSAAPPAPYNFTAAVFTSGVWEIRFRGDGVAMSSASSPQSVTLCVYTPAAPGGSTSADNSLIRAISIFGPTSGTRTWAYSGSAFVAK